MAAVPQASVGERVGTGNKPGAVQVIFEAVQAAAAAVGPSILNATSKESFGSGGVPVRLVSGGVKSTNTVTVEPKRAETFPAASLIHG
jgi:hypothetical protein